MSDCQQRYTADYPASISLPIYSTYLPPLRLSSEAHGAAASLSRRQSLHRASYLPPLPLLMTGSA
eukprot:11396-Eustigmatos_ZCMA.PRE.1